MRTRWPLYLTGFLILLFAAAGYFWLFADLPGVEIHQAQLQSPSIRIVDREGRLLYEDLPEIGGRHHAVPLDQISANLVHATIATEDQQFYSHPGVDVSGILRALWINLRGGETLAGGSTITQQVARNLLMQAQERGERTLRRKLREGLLAWQLTRRYSKDEVLSLYLNQTYYGALSYGADAAAQTYFGKPAAELSLAEAALLAGLPQAPGIYDPFHDPQAALDRRSEVLRLMEEAGYISAEQREIADHEPLALASTPFPMEAPHFSLWVRAQVDRLLSAEEISASGGLTVTTTLNLNAQHAAEQAVADHLQALREKGSRGLGYNVNNAALVAIDPNSGEILAMVGSPNAADTTHNGAINMAVYPRQPGSALKPIIYAAAFDPTRPDPWTAATSILDVRTSFVTHDNLPYTPANYDTQEHGPVLARQALASSLNIPAVLALENVGIPSFLDLCRKMGLSLPGDLSQYDLSIALGGGAVRLIDLTAAYGTFATGGLRAAPYGLVEIRDAAGQVLYSAPRNEPQRVLDERVAWLITDILSDDGAREIGFGLHSVLNIDRPAAVKTGTTTNFHDNWTIGYTPELVVGVWVGNASHEAMREVNGLTGAGPIWHQAIRAMLAGKPEQTFHRPAGLSQVEICTLSGLLPTDACPYRKLEWFIEGTEPARADTYYRKVTINSATGTLAGPDTPSQQRIDTLALDLPPGAANWAREKGLLLWSDLQRASANTAPGPGPSNDLEHGLAIVNPPAYTIYRLASSLPGSAQRIAIEAVGPNTLSRVTIWLDDQPLAVLDAPPYRAWWQLSEGHHEAWAEGLLSNGQATSSPRIEFEVTGEE
jgi:penicillin-binding protein 1C